MAYEFIATGLKPAQPVKSMLDSYMQGKEFQQNQEINKVNIDSAKTRNEAADIALKSAKKQVDAEDQWSKLPRAEDGSLDPQAEQQFKTAFPDYYDTRKKAEVAGIRDQLSITADKLKMSAVLFGNAKSPEDITKAQAFAKENFGLDVQYDESVFGAAKKYSSELAQKIELINEDLATAAANGDWETVTRLQEARNAEGKLVQLEILKGQVAIERDRSAAASSNANVYKYFQQGAKAKAEAEALTNADTTRPRDDVNLRVAEKSVTDLDALLAQVPSVEGAVKGEGLGAGNMLQRVATKAVNPVLTLFGDEGVKATAQEFGDAQTIRQFRKAVQIAFINNPKFPVDEQKKVEMLFSEINPDSVGSAKGTALIPLMEIITVLKNQREKSAAFLENRDPNYIERPRLGNDADPIVSPIPYARKDTPEMQEYLRKNGAKPGMKIQWPDGSTSTLGGKK